MKYVKPRLKKHESLKLLLETKEHTLLFEPNTFIEDVAKMKKVFLVSEPGYGKTRLLKEILNTDKTKGLFLDLKLLQGESLELYLQRDGIPKLPKTINEDELKNFKSFKTETFTLKNEENVTFCFDALDEVDQENFSKIVENLKDFIKKYNKTSILVSCRKNYINKWQYLFSEIAFDYVEIYPLGTQQVKEFLSTSGVSLVQTDFLLKKLHFRNRDSILSTPRYLEMVIEIVEKDGTSKLDNISRNELFELFIYKKLNIESEKKHDFSKNALLKNVLEKLALIMEIYQQNRITKNELIEFFDDTKSNLNITFLNQVPLSAFYERSLLRDHIDFVEFENTEFQEYLASKEIMRLGRPEQVTFELAVVKEIGEIHPSWLNTLSFLVESDIRLLKNILEYVLSNRQGVHIEGHLSLLPSEGLEKLEIQDRRSIFEMVFSYYQDSAHWIDYHVAEKLSFYFDETLYEYLQASRKKRPSSTTKTVIESNFYTLVAFLLEKGFFPPRHIKSLKNQIKRVLSNRGTSDPVIRQAIFALGKLKDISLFNDTLVQDLVKKGDEAIISSLIHALEEVEPNHPTSIKCFLEGLKRHNMSARYALHKIDSSKGINLLLKQFAEENDLFYQFLDHEGIYHDRDESLLVNIRKNIAKVKKNLHLLIIKAFTDRLWYRTEKSHFVEGIFQIMDANSQEYIFTFIKDVQNSALFAAEHFFALVLEKDEVKKFISKIKAKDGSNRIALNTLFRIKFSKRENASKIYEEGRKYLKSEYQLVEANQIRSTHPPQKKAESTYKDFLHYLEPEKGKFSTGVFAFFHEHKEEIFPLLKPEESNKFKKLIINIVLSKFDPGKHSVTINKRENGSTQYTVTSSWIHFFGDLLQAVQDLGLDITPYRQRILNYIPFSYAPHRETIFALVPDPTEKELKELFKLYTKRNDDLPVFMPSATIDLCKKFPSSAAQTILDFFIHSESLSLYERKNALEAMSAIPLDEEYFQKVLSKYESINRSLSDTANSILIEKYHNEKAIQWRFNELITRAFPFKRPTGTHGVSDIEEEIDDKVFAKPLMNLKEEKYRDDFLNLLDSSLDIFKKGEDFHSYAAYLWEIALNYFKHQKERRSFAPLRVLDKFVAQNLKREGINWFCYQYQKLKFEYIIFIGKPLNIADSIKKYNFFKEKMYLDVATPTDLLDTVKRVIDEDVRKWVEEEGAYKFINDYKRANAKKQSREDLIQKTIKTQFEIGLLKAGLRKEELCIQREAQLLDDKRTDFLIYYGFVGPLLIEIKLANNAEVKSKTENVRYRGKLLQYVNGTSSHFGIFLVLQVDSTSTLTKYLGPLQSVYSNDRNIEVIGLNCTSNSFNH